MCSQRRLPYHLQLLPGLALCLALHLFALCSVAVADEPSPIIGLPAIVSLSDDEQQVRVISFKKQLTIQVQEKTLLGHLSSVQRALYDIPQFLEGTVEGDPHSWARLTRESDDQDTGTTNISGHVFTDGILYKLQHSEEMGGTKLSALNSSVFKLPGSGLAPDDVTLKASSTNNASRAISIGIAIDSRFNEAHNGRGLAKALSIINGVDGLYQSQLGLAVEIESFRVYDDPATDPVRGLSGTVEQILENYRSIRLNDEELPGDLALTHLFSGYSDPESTIGLSWVGTACRLDGYDLSMSTPFPYQMLLAAHEIAHNLGALHDDDAQCNSDPSITGSEVMWSEISGTTNPSFSSCSLNHMRQTLEASCVYDNIDVGIALSASPTDMTDQQTVTISVLNNDQTRTATQLQSITTFPAETTLSNASAGCNVEGASLTCQHDSIRPDQTSDVSVTASFALIDNQILSSELVLSGFTDTLRHDNRAAIQIQASQATTSQSMAAPAPPEPADTVDNVNSSWPIVGAGGLNPLGLLLLSAGVVFTRPGRGYLKASFD